MLQDVSFPAANSMKRQRRLGPEHDWSSQAADAFRLMAIWYEEPPVKEGKSGLPPLPASRGTFWSA